MVDQNYKTNQTNSSYLSTIFNKRLILVALLLLVVARNNKDQNKLFVDGALSEEDRLQGYYERKYTWPPKYSPDTEGWKQLMSKRLEQIEEMEDSQSKWEGYIQTIPSAFYAPNFTEYGFGLTKAPAELTKTIQEAIHSALENNRYTYEKKIDVINGTEPPIFVRRQDLVSRVLKEFQPYVESWSKVKVKPIMAYGFRLYQNGSQLFMHSDKVQTHILSTIYHIDSSSDAEDWPIYIESLKDGKTYEVILQPGDILFYESTKCFHGRPKRLKGSWYTSLFVHYYPAEDWSNVDHLLEVRYAVPPHWHHTPDGPKKHTKLQMSGTSMLEPNCPNEWCDTQNTIKWNGPGEEGVWMDPSLNKYPLHNFAEKQQQQQQQQQQEPAGEL